MDEPITVEEESHANRAVSEILAIFDDKASNAHGADLASISITNEVVAPENSPTMDFVSARSQIGLNSQPLELRLQIFGICLSMAEVL